MIQNINVSTPNDNLGDKQICVYKHSKPNGEVFYIGIGNKDRPYKKGRTDFWRKITTKYPDYKIEVILDNLTWEEAIEVEIYLIKFYGRRDLGTGTLVNQKEGGDGGNLSIESRKKIGDANRIDFITKEKMYELFIIQNLTRKEIAEMYGVNESLVKKRILKDYKIKKDIKDYGYKNSKPPLPSNMKKVIDIVTKEIFDSIRIAAEKNNIKQSTLRHQLLGTYPHKTNLRYANN